MRGCTRHTGTCCLSNIASRHDMPRASWSDCRHLPGYSENSLSAALRAPVPPSPFEKRARSFALLFVHQVLTAVKAHLVRRFRAVGLVVLGNFIPERHDLAPHGREQLPHLSLTRMSGPEIER